jgi:hypothetical protein
MEGKRKRGFATMDPEKRREIQRLGGLTTQRSARRIPLRWKKCERAASR